MNLEIDSKSVLPTAGTYRSIEGLIQHRADHDQPALETPKDEVYARRITQRRAGLTSSPTAAVVPIASRTRPPSYIHFAIFPYLIVGHQISDLVAVLGSLNIIAAELTDEFLE